MSQPISLTDAERDIIVAAAQPIVDPEHRAAFMEAVVAKLSLHAEIGEGLIHRTCRELQRRFVNAPRSHGFSRHAV